MTDNKFQAVCINEDSELFTKGVIYDFIAPENGNMKSNDDASSELNHLISDWFFDRNFVKVEATREDQEQIKKIAKWIIEECDDPLDEVEYLIKLSKDQVLSEFQI